MPLGYELIADSGALASAVTQYDFTGLNISSDDVLMLVSDFANPFGETGYFLYANGNTIGANYYYQQMLAWGTNSIAEQGGSPKYSGNFYSGNTVSIIKLTENDNLIAKSKAVRNNVLASSIELLDIVTTSTITFSSITQLSIISSTSNGIKIGSRFKLYKLIARPLVDITLTADTTQVDITGLSLDETSELLLVADIQNGTASSANIELFFNNDTITTNYYKQELSADGTTLSCSRANDAVFTRLDAINGNTLAFANIKLTNNGYPLVQSNSIREIGTSGVNLIYDYLSKTGIITKTTQLNIKSSVTNAIGTGSRFKLYKLK